MALTITKHLGKLHIYLGLTLGFLFSLLCLTGALIVYKPEVEKLAIPHLARIAVPEGGKPLSLDSLYANVRRVYPEYTLENIVLYGEPYEAYSFRSRRSGEAGRVQIYVNQYTGEVLGVDHYKHKLMQWLYDLHVNLFMGKFGKVLVGLLAWLCLAILASGLWVSLAKYRRVLRLKSHNRRTRLFRWHNLIGLYTFPLLTLIVLTGGYWGMPEVYQKVFETLVGGQALASAPQATLQEDKPLASVERVLRSAEQRLPDARATLIFLPRGKKTCYSVRMRLPSDYARTGDNHLYFDPHTGDFISSNLWQDKSPAERWTRAMYFLHFGEFGGHWTRVLWLFVGLSVPLLYGVGVYLYLRKRRHRHATK